MARTAMINVRTEPEIKTQAEILYNNMGISLSDAINMFLCKSLDYHGLPFELCNEIPNAETIAAMREAEDISNGRIQSKSYSSFKDMLDDAIADDEEE